MKCQRPFRVILLLSLIVFLGCGFCLSGCKAQSNKQGLTLSDFDFLTPETSPEELIDRVSMPDRFVGSGLVRWQYDLVDGRMVEVIFVEGPLVRVREEDGTWVDMDISSSDK